MMLNVSKCRFGDALLDLLFFAAAIAPAIIIILGVISGTSLVIMDAKGGVSTIAQSKLLACLEMGVSINGEPP